MTYYAVSRGDSPRDYMMRNYQPQALIGKFRLISEAEAFIAGDGGKEYYSGVTHCTQPIPRVED